MKTLSLTAVGSGACRRVPFRLHPAQWARTVRCPGRDTQRRRHPSSRRAPVREIVDRQLGARYGASDREAVARCVTAALAQGAILFGVNGYAGTKGYAAYVGAYRPGRWPAFPAFPVVAATMRVSAITDVQRRAGGGRAPRD